MNPVLNSCLLIKINNQGKKSGETPEPQNTIFLSFLTLYCCRLPYVTCVASRNGLFGPKLWLVIDLSIIGQSVSSSLFCLSLSVCLYVCFHICQLLYSNGQFVLVLTAEIQENKSKKKHTLEKGILTVRNIPT